MSEARRVWRPGFRLDVALTLSALPMGRRDPTHQRAADGAIWRTAVLPSGEVTYRLAQRAGTVEATAWGPGGDEALAGLEDLLGAGDHPETFRPAHPVLQRAHRRLAGLRVPRTGQVFDSLVQAVLHQKINGRDAAASWAELVGRHGRPAPGPHPGLRLPLRPDEWLAVPVWEWRRAGVEPSATQTIRFAAHRAGSLERAATRSRGAAYEAMAAMRGVGRWSMAEVGHRALGDADALSVGDYHLVAITSHALAGRPLTEEEVEPFYEPWRPHRYRVMRLLELTPSAWPPRRGPRMERPEHRYGRGGF